MSHTSTAYIFTGHMVDQHGRAQERFPPRLVGPVRLAIERQLERCNAGPGDAALCQGANGGDLLFAFAALARGMAVTLALPFEESEFLKQSVAPAGQQWCDLFQEIVRHPRVTRRELAGSTSGPEAFAQANVTLLDIACEAGQPLLLALWDGKASKRAGGTDDMINAARGRGIAVTVIDLAGLLESAPDT